MRPLAESTGAAPITFSAANALLVLGLLRGNADGWTSTTILSLLIGAAVLSMIFIAIELRVDSRCSRWACSATPRSPVRR